MILRSVGRTLLLIIISIILFIVLYLLTALGLSEVRVNKRFVQTNDNGVNIYLLTNGVHTDIALPIKNELKDWRLHVDPAATRSGSSAAEYVSFGWGDKGFYLETPTWADLKFSTAFKAMFYLGSSAMHVTYYPVPKVSESCRKICVDKETYSRIVQYIENSFDRDEQGKFQLIKANTYGANDAFYEARGSYSMFYTCNTWTNNGLKSGSLRACLWTPFESGVLSNYPLTK